MDTTNTLTPTFTRLKSGRGRPRFYTSNKSGNVRITITLPGEQGNISRTLTFSDTKVTEVYSAILNTLVGATKK
jgi:hypothetical protein